MRGRPAAAILLALWAAASAAQTDGETSREAEIPTPPYPASENLIEFYVGPTATARFRIDATSLSIGNDGVMRFVLVVEAPGGAINVSFEGLRCASRERRVYAFGRNDRSWHPVKELRWVPVRSVRGNSPYASLMRNYLCPDGVPVRDVAEAKRNLLGRRPATL
ncbi:MAG: hypothetical protein OHK0026_10050 [Rhodocyclaceae bacterium]